eukprot:gene14522-16028_t
MELLAIILVICKFSLAATEEIMEESGSGMYGDYQAAVVSGSGMLGDEIMPISAIDNFNGIEAVDKNQNEVATSDDNDDVDAVEKRGKINRVAKGGTKTPAKRFWNRMYPYFHWLQAQQQQQQQQITVQQYHTQPVGKCLEENSLCDIGHDEQCCGHATYCVDYWGVGKCLAFTRPDKYDSLAMRINRNNLYKAYYKRLQYAATRVD